ncbi:MAG: cyclic nucleotide-binding domain-containing protein [Myxococcaceae bacterium]
MTPATQPNAPSADLLVAAERVALIASSPLFEMLSNAELEGVASLLSPRTLKAGDTIFTEGALGDGLYVVESGEVEVSASSKQGVLATLGTGECFGEMALVDKDYRSATVRARTDVALLHLSPESLAQFRKTHKDGFGFLVMNIARLLSVRLRAANRG